MKVNLYLLSSRNLFFDLRKIKIKNRKRRSKNKFLEDNRYKFTFIMDQPRSETVFHNSSLVAGSFSAPVAVPFWSHFIGLQLSSAALLQQPHHRLARPQCASLWGTEGRGPGTVCTAFAVPHCHCHEKVTHFRVGYDGWSTAEHL